jgi:drug/metabolite transporter (DMT)-like permease
VGSHQPAASAFIIVAVFVFFTTLLVNRIPALQQVNGAIAGFVGIAV